MNNYINLFRELFPTFIRYDSFLYSVELYATIELDLYLNENLRITIGINSSWKKLTKNYDVTGLRLEKIKELHEQLSNPF